MVLQPLFFGPPGGPELLVMFFVLLLKVGVALFVGRWVYRDANRRGSSNATAVAIVVGVLFVVNILLGVAGIVIYVVIRDDI